MPTILRWYVRLFVQLDIPNDGLKPTGVLHCQQDILVFVVPRLNKITNVRVFENSKMVTVCELDREVILWVENIHLLE